MTTTLTKKPTTDEMLKVAIEMRKHQKAFFATRDAMELRKSKELEKQFDEMVLVYSGKVQIEDENKLNLFTL
jgi:Ni,Fe-hydrogenase I small subunit